MKHATYNYSRLSPLIDQLAGRRILIIGDLILDEYLIGRAGRLSREAPIPVLEFERRDLIPGGAANPGVNVIALGSQAVQIGLVGADDNAQTLINLLHARNIDTTGIVTDRERPTTTKTRIMAHMGLHFPQQVARIDRIDRRAVNSSIEQAISQQLCASTGQIDAILVSDYLTGLLTESVVTKILTVSRDCHIPAIADAQGELNKYHGFAVVKCNADEVVRYVQRELRGDADFAAAGQTIFTDLQLTGAMLITRGPEGITALQSGGQSVHIPAPHVEDVYDTVGAGDTVLAVVGLAVVAGATYAEAAALANLAAGIVVRKVGNYAPSPDELRAAVREQTEMTWPDR